MFCFFVLFNARCCYGTITSTASLDVAPTRFTDADDVKTSLA